MAKKAKKKNIKQTNTTVVQLPVEIIGAIAIFLGILICFRLGFVGVALANLSRYIVGDLYQVCAVLLIGIGGLMIVSRWITWRLSPRVVIGSFLVTLSAFVFVQMLNLPMVNYPSNIMATLQFVTSDLFQGTISNPAGGGLIGSILYTLSYFLFSGFGTILLIGILLTIGAALLVNFTAEDGQRLFTMAKQGFSRLLGHLSRDEDETETEIIVAEAEIEEPLTRRDEDEATSSPLIVATPVEEPEPFKITRYDAYPVEDVSMDEEEQEPFEPRDIQLNKETSDEHFVLPTIALLNPAPQKKQTVGDKALQENKVRLKETFAAFGINVEVTGVNVGPTVTKYEIKPSQGVKVSRIVNLADDIALALAAKDVRIEAPIPGKSLIGIEVPNGTTTMVSFSEIIAPTLKSGKILEVPLGKDVSGTIRTADLTKMPHLLVAGATGSGKSVAINGIITSILMKAKPSEVKLMMIDPKKVELNVYNGIPHLLLEVVTNPRKAAQALQKVVQEMERRYELFAATGTRNIDSYNNEAVSEENLEAIEPTQPLPYIVVIVDELADLMMVASNEVEDAIIRLAQMARAAGIHMVLATQRPSVDVITGIIKANVPSRMAFAVSSGIDSRTILDTNGAEKLLGRGDMLFQPMGENKPIRIQGAFLSDEEVERVVNHIKAQQGENYTMELTDVADSSQGGGEPEDELFQQVLQFLLEQETVSISLLQRKFRIGYNRSARLIDDLENRRLIGPSDGSKPRKVDTLAIEALLYPTEQ